MAAAGLPAAPSLLAISVATLAVTSLLTTIDLVSCSGISGCSVVQAPSRRSGGTRPSHGFRRRHEGVGAVISDDVFALKLPGGAMPGTSICNCDSPVNNS